MCEKLKSILSTYQKKIKAFYLFLIKKYIMAKGTHWRLRIEGSQSNKVINDKNNNNKLAR